VAGRDRRHSAVAGGVEVCFLLTRWRRAGVREAKFSTIDSVSSVQTLREDADRHLQAVRLARERRRTRRHLEAVIERPDLWRHRQLQISRAFRRELSARRHHTVVKLPHNLVPVSCPSKALELAWSFQALFSRNSTQFPSGSSTIEIRTPGRTSRGSTATVYPADLHLSVIASRSGTVIVQ